MKNSKQKITPRLRQFRHYILVGLGVFVLALPAALFFMSSGKAAGDITFVQNISGATAGSGVTTDSDNNLYVADGSTVQKFNSSGSLVTSWAASGEQVAAFSNTFVYVADGNQIEKFDTSGSSVTSWGSAGSGDGEFGGQVRGLAVDSLGNVYVGDSANYRVQKFDSSGTFITKWGSNGTGDGQFSNSYIDIAIDSSDVVYTLDSNQNKLQKFDSDGNFISGHILSSALSSANILNTYSIDINSLDQIYIGGGFNIARLNTDYDGVVADAGIAWFGGPQIYQGSIVADSTGKVYISELSSGGVVRQYEDTSILSIDTDTLADATVDTAYSQALTTSNNDGDITFSISAGTLPAGTAIDSGTGTISGTPTAAGVYTFTVQAVDNVVTATKEFDLSVAPDAQISITTASLPDGEVGTTYSQTVATTDGVDPITFSVSVGSLPGGLSLDISTGEISGTPTTAGDFTFTIQAADAFNSDTQEYTVSVPNPSTITITKTSLADGTVGSAYSQTVTVAGSSGAVTYSKTSGSLPPGISLNTTSGKISGTPSTNGTYAFTIRAADSFSNDSQSYNVNIQNPISDDSSTTGSTDSSDDTPTEFIAPETEALNDATKEAIEKKNREDITVAETQELSKQNATLASIVAALARRLNITPKQALQASPWAVLVGFGAIASVAIYQLTQEAKRAAAAHKRLAFHKRLTDEKTKFISLASHYLRTPITVMKGGVELAESSAASAANSVKVGIDSLQLQIDEILVGVSSLKASPQNDTRAQADQKTMSVFRPGFIGPTITVAVLLVSANYLITYLGQIDPNVASLLAQASAFAFICGVLFVALNKRTHKQKEIRRLDGLLNMQYELDNNRNSFISSITSKVRPAISAIKQAISPSIGDQPKRLVEAGVNELEGTLTTFDTVSGLQARPAATKLTKTKLTDIVAQAEQDVPGLAGRVQAVGLGNQTVNQPGTVLRTVLAALMANAIQHSGTNSTVTVRFEKKRNRNEIVVSDNGRGIAKDKMNELFTPLSFVEDVDDKTHQGKGMSLFVSRLIMRYVGGDLVAESEVGKGTSMRILLPNVEKA